MTAWTHDGLMVDLAAHLRHGGKSLTWTNIPAGRAGEPRPDVLTMRPWGYDNPQIVAYECKISTADFRSDVTSGKWQAYLSFAQGVTFAVPHGLVTAADVPASCGLILRSERGWRHVRRPTLTTAAHIPQAVWVKLVSTPPNRVIPQHGGAEDSTMRYYRSETERRIDAHARREIGKRYGEEIARYLAAPATAKEILDGAKEKADRIIDRAKGESAAIMRESRKHLQILAEPLGITETEPYLVMSAVHERARLLTEAGAVAALSHTIERIQKALAEGMALQQMASAATPTIPTDSDHPTV